MGFETMSVEHFINEDTSIVIKNLPVNEESIELIRAEATIAKSMGYPYMQACIFEGDCYIEFSPSKMVSTNTGYQRVEFDDGFCTLLYHRRHHSAPVNRYGKRAMLIISNVINEALYRSEEDMCHLGYLLTEARFCGEELLFKDFEYGIPVYGPEHMFRSWTKDNINHPLNRPGDFSHWDLECFVHFAKNWLY